MRALTVIDGSFTESLKGGGAATDYRTFRGALVSSLCSLLFGRLVPRVFGQRVVLRSIAGGAVIGLVGLVLPELMFSGESKVHPIIADPTRYGMVTLLLLAVSKPLLVGLPFQSSYLGGPIFPVMFACTMVGMALHSSGQWADSQALSNGRTTRN